MQYIIITGNPVDGFEFFGPFNTAEDAIEWGARGDYDQWSVAPMQLPEGGE